MESSVTERGAITLPTIIAIVLGIGFCASAYLNYAQHEQSSQNETLLQGQITDLKYQLNQDSASPSPSPIASKDPSPSASPSPSSAPAVAGTASVPISQFNVKFTANDPITDITYQPEQSGSYLVAAFTTQSLIAKYPACHAGAIGSLVRKLAGRSSVSGADSFSKNIAGYNYYYVSPGYYCAGTTDGRNEIAQDEAQLKNDLEQSLAQQ
jgi:hypothetical protein